MSMWLLATLLTPLACGALLLVPRTRAMAAALAPFAAWPALGAAALPVGSQVELTWLILGARLGVDAISPGFLILTALVWSAVGFHLRGLPEARSVRYLACFFGAMSGNLGVVVALDPLTYYAAFGLLTFAAYGLITTDAEPASRRAGRIYLVLGLAAEMAMLVGFMTLAAGGALPLALWTLYAGMGVKHGLLPFHVWLPVAHGTAPTPSSALLSGAILKAGLVGWLRFLAPDQVPSLATMADMVMIGGMAAALLGATAGILQRRPKMLLGYSSISQMGLVTVAVGVAAQSGRWDALLPMLVLMAFHHATVKGALFLGLGVIHRPWVWPLLLLLSLSLAAAPGTGGALAKGWLMAESGGVPTAELLWLSSLSSTLLMGRFLWLARIPQPHADAQPWPFLALSVAGMAGPWCLIALDHPQPALLAAKALGWSSAWPVLTGGGLALVAWWVGRKRLLPFPALPPGDIVVLVERLSLHRIILRRPTLPALQAPLPALAILEAHVRRLPAVGLVFFALLLAFVLAWGGMP